MGYKAYKDIKGVYEFGEYTLLVDHVQGDPFASPSRVRVRISQKLAGFPEDTFRNRSREVALRDFLTRKFFKATKKFCKGRRGTGKSGLILIDKIVRDSLFFKMVNEKNVYQHVKTAEDADFLREQLDELGLVAFVAEGAILPRASGIDSRPLTKDRVVPFESPETLRVEIELPNRGSIAGMGIPKGVTLIVGGGYHGKSTLLDALELGVYNHIPGDGREFVVTDPRAMKIRAEEGRRIEKVDM